MESLNQCAGIILNSNKIFILTGAGMSTESGIPDFRSNTGLYSKEFQGLTPEIILSLSFFKRNPKAFWKYISEYMNYSNAEPNIGHYILAKWGEKLDITIVTQNIEQLHTLAGSTNVIEIHGSIKTCTCQGCNKKYSQDYILSQENGYLCDCGSFIKPDIVLYEESVDKMSLVYPLIEQADLLIVLGTSLTVYPVAAIPEYFNRRDKYMIVINKTHTPYNNEPNCIEINESIGITLEKINSLIEGKIKESEYRREEMAIDRVRKYFKELGINSRIQEFEVSSATVALAAEALGCEPERIAKTLSFMVNGKGVLIVAAGDAKIDNAKFKEQFHTKAKMLATEEVEVVIGHEIGGVCPFGIKDNVEVYLDVSLKRFVTVYPACGSSNSAIELTIEELEKYSGSIAWIDVCKSWMDC